MRYPWSLKRCFVAVMVASGLNACVNESIGDDPVVPDVQSKPIVVNEDTTVSCTACAIELSPIAELGTVGDLEIFGAIPAIVRSPDGRFYGVPTRYARHPILVFSSDGAFLSVLGRTGRGPGEYTTVASLAVDSGNIVVAHDGNRITSFDSAGRVVSTTRVTPLLAERVIPWTQGQYVMMGALRTPESVGYPAHLVNADGSVTRSLGTTDVQGHSGRQLRVTASAPDGGLWLADYNNYRLEYVDSLLETRRLLAVRVPRSFLTRTFAVKEELDSVLVRSEPARNIPDNLPPPPFEVTGLFARDSVVVVAMRVLRTDWTDRKTGLPNVETSGINSLEEARQRLYDTVIDVVHGEKGEVLARRRIEGSFALLNDGTVVRYEMKQNGYISVAAFSMSVHFPNQPTR